MHYEFMKKGKHKCLVCGKYVHKHTYVKLQLVVKDVMYIPENRAHIKCVLLAKYKKDKPNG